MLLALMLVLIVGSASILIARLNEHASDSFRDTRTQLVLGEAKQALISFAMNYPDFYTGSVAGRGPGYLPCPDQNDDGLSQTNCADNTQTTLGRLPYETLGLTDLRDSSGERLWYAVSQNFKYNQPADHVINSERPGTISVDGVGDVVAVIIAPEAPLSTQGGRRGSTETAAVAANDVFSISGEYLEDDNATNGDASYVTTGTAEFNDRVIVITRSELMAAVEKRVISEVRAVLSEYRSINGAYPWLTPFADPKTAFVRLTGSHTVSNNEATTLEDSGKDYSILGIQTGDVVENTTDGSSGTISAVTSTDLTVSGLAYGLENDFDTDDEYIVYTQHKGITDAGSAGSTTMFDFDVDFNEIGVSPGDVIDNLSDGSSGVIQTVAATSLVVSPLTGGTTNTFSPGATYRIRSDTGVATAGSALVLTDNNNNFVRMGVRVGDAIANVTDGSIGRVSSVTANSISAAALNLGTENDFDVGDVYYIARYNTDNATREGLLSFHELHKHFKTGFSVSWNLTGATATSNVVAASPHATYTADLVSKAQTFSGGIGTITFNSDDGQCIWLAEAVADCMATYLDPDFPVQGTVTSLNNNSILIDANANFTNVGLKRGDIVRNFDDEAALVVSGTATTGTSAITLKDTSKNFTSLGIVPYFHLILNTTNSNARALVTSVVDDNTLNVVAFPGGATNLDSGDNYAIYSPQQVVVTTVTSGTQLSTVRLTAAASDFDTDPADEFYQINIATGRRTGTATSLSAGTYLQDTSATFSDIQIGDIVENTTDNAWGIINSVGSNSLNAQLYASDGSIRNFGNGEGYRIYYDHDVNFRRYEIKTNFTGTPHVYSSGGQRKRDVCLGYNGDCSSSTGDVSVPEQRSIFIIRDQDYRNVEVGKANVNIPSSGLQGSINVSGVDYYLNDDETIGDLPQWFITNKWHQFVHAAFSSAYTAGATPGGCPAQGACLQLQAPLVTYTDREAIVLTAGMPLDVIQSNQRATGAPGGYYEGTNSISGDGIFAKDDLSAAFNDQLGVVCPDGNNPACP